MGSKKPRDKYYIGQVGDFLLYDSFYNPIERIHGKIVNLMDGQKALYALIETERGIRPARLAKIPDTLEAN